MEFGSSGLDPEIQDWNVVFRVFQRFNGMEILNFGFMSKTFWNEALSSECSAAEGSGNGLNGL